MILTISAWLDGAILQENTRIGSGSFEQYSVVIIMVMTVLACYNGTVWYVMNVLKSHFVIPANETA